MTLLQFMNNNMQLKEYENIKLYHGDCMDLMRETPDKYYDIAIVDKINMILLLLCQSFFVSLYQIKTI